MNAELDVPIVLPKKTEDKYNLIFNVLKGLNNNVSATARTLKISTTTIRTARDWVDSVRPPLPSADDQQK